MIESNWVFVCWILQSMPLISMWIPCESHMHKITCLWETCSTQPAHKIIFLSHFYFFIAFFFIIIIIIIESKILNPIQVLSCHLSPWLISFALDEINPKTIVGGSSKKKKKLLSVNHPMHINRHRVLSFELDHAWIKPNRPASTLGSNPIDPRAHLDQTQ